MTPERRHQVYQDGTITEMLSSTPQRLAALLFDIRDDVIKPLTVTENMKYVSDITSCLLHIVLKHPFICNMYTEDATTLSAMSHDDEECDCKLHHTGSEQVNKPKTLFYSVNRPVIQTDNDSTIQSHCKEWA